MADIDIENDLNMVNDQISKLVEEVNKVNAARENLIQQVQNLNGVAMYLRGKLQPTEEIEQADEADKLLRTAEYPEAETATKK